MWARFVVHKTCKASCAAISPLSRRWAALHARSLTDRMKTAAIGEDEDGLVIYNRALLDLARHYGFLSARAGRINRKRKAK